MALRSTLLRVLCLILAVSLLSGCTPVAALPTATGTPQPPTATASPTATWTLTPLPPTATPTPTRTPRPTSTPIGYYALGHVGVSFSVPKTWRTLETGKDRVIVSDSSYHLLFAAQGGTEFEEQSIEDIVLMWQATLGTDRPIRIIHESETTIGEGLAAVQVDLGVGFPTQQDWRIYYTYQSGRSYQFVFIAEPGVIETRERTIRDLLQTVRLYRPEPFSLPRDETLVLLGSSPEASQMDPALTTSSAAGYVGLLFSGLVRLSDDLQVVPDLAERWEISPDGLTYTFTLREGLAFSSGKIITANDVRVSWERATAKETGSPTAGTYLGDIVGVKEKLAGTAEEISGVEAVDLRTLKVTLDAPKPYFLAKLTYPTAFVVRIADIEIRSKTWMFSPDSTGPYEVKEYHPGESIIFMRNTDYYEPAATKYIVFNLAPDDSPISLYEEGSIDMLALDDELVRRVQVESDALHAQWRQAPSLCTSMVQIDPAKPPMDDLNVRKALAQAIDPQAFLEQLDASRNIPARSILPPAMPGYTDQNTALAFDPAAAKQALRDSKYAGELPVITITAGGYGQTDRDDITALVEMWQKNLNIQVQVEYVDPSNLTEAARKNHSQMVMYNWCADYPDPQNFLDLLYHSDSDFNVATYHNAAVDALLESARTDFDPASRLTSYQQVEALLLEDVAVIPLFHSMVDMLVKPRVQGFNLSPAQNNALARLSLDPTLDE